MWSNVFFANCQKFPTYWFEEKRLRDLTANDSNSTILYFFILHSKLENLNDPGAGSGESFDFSAQIGARAHKEGLSWMTEIGTFSSNFYNFTFWTEKGLKIMQ